MSKKFTPADEKVLAEYFAWLSLVRALQVQGVLDPELLLSQLGGAEMRLTQIGETGAAEHIRAHIADVHRLIMTPPHNQQVE
ncbi:hypothetical protein QCD58_002135 [Enterobacter hormaechei]|nr:hypothetical protein [Enterobacter hormaechei]